MIWRFYDISLPFLIIKMCSDSLDQNTSEPTPGPSAAMRRAVGSARVLRPQEWPCYHSERTYLMLPSLRGGWGRNAVSRSISSTFTCRLINWWESRWEIFVLCRTSQGVWRAVNGDFSRGDICQKQIPGACVFLFDRFLDSKAGFLAFWSEFTIPLKRFFVYFAWSGDLRHLTSECDVICHHLFHGNDGHLFCNILSLFDCDSLIVLRRFYYIYLRLLKSPWPVRKKKKLIYLFSHQESSNFPSADSTREFI